MDVKTNVPYTNQNISSQAKIKFDIEKFFSTYGVQNDSDVLDSYNPVVQKIIGTDNQKGVTLTGEFKTNYDAITNSELGGYSYISFRKSSKGKANAFNGYGIAWRPLTKTQNTLGPSTTLSIAGDVYSIPVNIFTGLGQQIAYVERDINGKNYFAPVSFNLTAGEGTSCILSNMMGEELVNGDLLYLAQPNVFIVDNDLINADIYQGQYMESTSSVMAYIKSAVVNIIKDTTYFFKLEIGEDNQIDFYLNTTGSFTSEDKVISSGSATPLSAYLETSDIDSMGVSVINTGGYQWYYDNFTLIKNSAAYATFLAEIDTSLLTNSIGLHISGYGVGVNESSVANGLIAKLWNPTNSVWDTVITNTFTSTQISVSDEIIRDTYEVDGKIKCLVQTMYPREIDVSESLLTIDYIKFESSYNVGVHVGGCVDVYVDDDALQEKVINVSGATGTLYSIDDAAAGVVLVAIDSNLLQQVKQIRRLHIKVVL